jgi:hypothetical protein
MGATGTFAVNTGNLITGPLTSSGAITSIRKTGGGTVTATDVSKASNLTAASTVEVAGGTFVARSRTGPGATTAQPSSIGDAKISLTGGTFHGIGSATYETAGQAGRIGVTFFSGASNERQIGPFGDPAEGGIDKAPLGLLLKSGGKTIDYKGALAFDDDNPDYGHPNFNAVSGGHVGVDNLQVLGYGLMTFTNGGGAEGNDYSFGAWSDDGVTLNIDLDNDGKFEPGDNGKGQDELVFTDNTFHAPQARTTPAAVTIPPGTYRFAAGFYEGGGNAVMDFYVARGTQAATNYDELKANFKQINPSDTSIISKISSILLTSNNDFTANPISVTENSGLTGDGGARYGTVTISDGKSLSVGGQMSIDNTVINGTARMNFQNQIDFGKIAPGTAGANFTLLKGGPATVDLRNATTKYTDLPANGSIGVAEGTLILAGAQGTNQSSIGPSGRITLAGGLLEAVGQFAITETVGAANKLTEYVYNIGGNQTPLIDPIFDQRGLFAITPSQTLSLEGPLAGYDDAFIQTRWGQQDNVVAMWYGEMDFKSAAGTGNQYTFASKTDDGSTWWIDLDNDGKFERGDNGSGVSELVLNNNFYQGPTARRGVAIVPPGTHRVALGFYEGGGGALADFKWDRGDIPIPDVATYDASLTQLDPTDSSIATFRARTYAPTDLATPSFGTNPVTVTGNSTIFSNGASAFGATTFANTATVNTTGAASSFASLTTTTGIGTLRNSVGANRITVGDVGASAGATTVVTGNDTKITGSITGAGTVRLDGGVYEFSRNGAASTGTPSVEIRRNTTMRAAPGAGNTFGAQTVAAIGNEGLIHAANGVMDLSGATITTLNVPGGLGAGLFGGRVEGGTNATEFPASPTVDLRLSRAQTTDIPFFGGNLGTWVYTGEIRLPDTDGDGTPGPVAFAEQFDDYALLKIEGVEYINNTAWDIPHSSGAIELADTEPDGKGTAGDGWFSFEARFGDTGGGIGPNSGFDLGFGIDLNPADGFDAKTDIASNTPRATRSQYVEPVDPGNRSLFRIENNPVRTGNVQVDAGATLRVGALINANDVILAPGARLELHNGTSRLAVSEVLDIPGNPGAATATWDMTDADLIAVSTAATKTADFNAIYSDLKQGFNQGDWKGLGITSSTAAANTNADTGVTLVDNALLGLTDFGGQPVDANSLLLKYTYYGDIDQNGQVDADDLTVFAGNFGRTSGATQVDGDIDFNGTVDADDLTIFANNFNKGVGSPLGAASVQAVPEPTSLVLAGLGAAGILAGVAARRRNNRKD